jgi:uncharacterized protein YbjT (DUF2867 family)
MKVLVAGGTGTLGRRLVDQLRSRGHDVRVFARRASTAGGVEVVTGDLTTGAGIATAVAGVEVVINATNSVGASVTRPRSVLVDGSRRLGEAAAAAGVRHHLLISIVGIDDVPMAYYRAKLEQEAVLQEGDVAWTLLRATQFHHLLDRMFTVAARLPVLPVPDVLVQPVDPDEVAAALVEAAEAAPAGRLPDMAGPEMLRLPAAARQWRAIRSRRRPIVRIPLTGRTGAALRHGVLTAPERARGRVRFADWLQTSSNG